jgi:hypothetical protein
MHPDLAKLARAEQLANDIAAYKAMPQTEEEIAWGSLPQDWSISKTTPIGPPSIQTSSNPQTKTRVGWRRGRRRGCW